MTTFDFSELMQYLETKFAAIDRQFVYIEERFDTIDRKFEEIDRRFEEMDRKFEEKFDNVYRILDGHTKQLEDIQIEMVAHNSVMNRHEHWHHQTASKLGLKLEY